MASKFDCDPSEAAFFSSAFVLPHPHSKEDWKESDMGRLVFGCLLFAFSPQSQSVQAHSSGLPPPSSIRQQRPLSEHASNADQRAAPATAGRIRVLHERFVASYKEIYSADHPLNLTRRSYRDFDSVSLVGVNGDSLLGLRSIAESEHYDLLDEIKPTAMGRADFIRSVLRESARRSVVMSYYERRIQFPLTMVTVDRPLDAAPEQSRRVTESPTFITVRDAAVAILNNPLHASINAAPDVMQQNGLSVQNGNTLGLTILSDTAVYDLGYTMGAVPQNRPTGSLPMGLVFREQAGEVQRGYCAIVGDIFARQGRNVDQLEAFSAGFAQARIDARELFVSLAERVGLTEECSVNGPGLTPSLRIFMRLDSATR